MFKFLKSQKFPINLFIISSLAAFVIVASFFFVLSMNRTYAPSNVNPVERYYFKDNNIQADPFITKQPGLKDVLAGPIISALDPVLGYGDAPIVIVEYSDYKCDFCHQQEKVLKMILQKYKSQVRLIWKDFPDRDQNSISYKASVAARCAGEQNQYWGYHEFLYQYADRLDDKTFINIADSLKLNKKKFTDCLQSGRMKKLVNDNIKEADALLITGVPFFYINDKEILGAVSFDELDKMIAAEISKSNK
jgi:protein-disulfide isomerase